MSGLTIDEFIKIGIGFLVVVLVVVGFAAFANGNVLEFIKGLYSGNKQAFFSVLLK